MTDRLPVVAAKLASALRLMPCCCIAIGEWPLFKAEAAGTPAKPGKHTPKTCARCSALAEYDAFVSIVQTPALEKARVEIIQAPARKCEACGQVVK